MKIEEILKKIFKKEVPTLTKVPCPLCGKEYDISEKIKECQIYDSDRLYQIWDIHAEDILRESLENDKNAKGHLNEAEIIQPCECDEGGKGHPFHIIICEGDKSTKYVHWLESLLDFPTENVKKRKIWGYIGIPGYRRLVAIGFALLLGIVFCTIYPNIIYHITGYTELFFKDYLLIHGVLAGLLLSFVYTILKDIKIAYGKLERHIPKGHNKDQVDLIYSLIYSPIIYLLFCILILPSPWFDNLTHSAWIVDIADFFDGFIFAAGAQTFLWYGIFLYTIPHYRIEGNFFELQDVYENFVDISIKITLYVTIIAVLFNLHQWLFMSHEFIEMHSMGGIIGYHIMAPLFIIVFFFTCYAFVLHKLMFKLKKRELERIHRELTTIEKEIRTDEEQKLSPTLNGGPSALLDKTQRLSMMLSLLLSLEEKVKKTREWPISVGIITQLIIGIIIALIPLALKSFEYIT